MVDDEKKLLNDIFEAVNPANQTVTSDEQQTEQAPPEGETAIKPIPLKTVEQLLRDAANQKKE